MRLVRPAPSHEAAFEAMRAEYRAHGDERYHARVGPTGPGSGTTRSGTYQDYLDLDARLASGDPPPGWAPQCHYFLERDDGRLLGNIRFRPELAAHLWEDGGNIGYDIRPTARGQGYATQMLRLVLDVARAHGLDWVLLTVEPANAASIRVMEKCGAYSIGVAAKSGNRQYRIDLA